MPPTEPKSPFLSHTLPVAMPLHSRPYDFPGRIPKAHLLLKHKESKDRDSSSLQAPKDTSRISWYSLITDCLLSPQH